jgi:hypothetical protein
MRATILSFPFLFLATFVSPALVGNAFAGDILSETTKLAKFTQSFTHVYMKLVNVVTASGELDEIVTGVINGEISKRYGREAGRDKLIRLKLSLDNADEEISALKAPRFQNVEYNKITSKLLKYLSTLRDQMQGHFEDSSQLFAQLQSGQKIDLDKASKRTYHRMEILLNGENQLILTNLLSMKPSHPEYHVQSIVMLVNKFVLELVDLISNFDKHKFSHERVANTVSRGADYLKGIYGHIESGKDARAAWTRKLDQQYSGQNQVFVKALIVAMKSYDKSFEIEAQIANLMADIRRLLLSGGTAEEFFSSYIVFASKIEILTNKRMMLASSRQNTIANIK